MVLKVPIHHSAVVFVPQDQVLVAVLQFFQAQVKPDHHSICQQLDQGKLTVTRNKLVATYLTYLVVGGYPLEYSTGSSVKEALGEVA